MAADLADDLSISDNDELWRRLTSQAFQNYPKKNSLSVLLADHFVSYEEPLRTFPGYGLAGLKAGEVRERGSVGNSVLLQGSVYWRGNSLKKHATSDQCFTSRRKRMTSDP